MWVIHPVFTNYEVSNCGKIRHISSSNERATRIDRYGYKRLNLLHKGKHKTVTIHRMVATCFVDNPLCLITVNHINGNKLDNRSINLEWMSVKENISDSYNRTHGKCIPVIYNGIKYRSKREAGRMTGKNRLSL